MNRVDELRGRLEGELPRLATSHDVPGASVAVWLDGQQLEATTGVVNLRTRVPVTPDALFMIQSITKIWTATAVLQLVDDGLVGLDDPVRRHLPEFSTADRSLSGQVTVRHLLTHTGGFEGDLWLPTTDGPDALQRFVEDLVPTTDQHSRPGAMFSYSNTGIGVLGRLLEVLRDAPYEQVLRSRLFEPLGLDEVAFSANQALAFRTAIGHGVAVSGGPLRPLPVWAVMPASNPAAGNQLAMSARDLLALGLLHLDDGLAPDGRRLLSSAAVRAMRTPQIAHPASWAAGSAHGLGWSVPGRGGLIEHGGDTIGVASTLQVVPDHGFAVAVLTNAGGGHDLITELVDPLLAEFAGVAPAVDTVVPEPSRVADPARYTGRYETRVRRSEVTCDDDGRLWLERTWQREGAALAEVAGVPDETTRAELRLVGGTDEADDAVFVQVDESGAAAGKVALVGRDDEGRARFLHDGRAAPARAD